MGGNSPVNDDGWMDRYTFFVEPVEGVSLARTHALIAKKGREGGVHTYIRTFFVEPVEGVSLARTHAARREHQPVRLITHTNTQAK